MFVHVHGLYVGSLKKLQRCGELLESGDEWGRYGCSPKIVREIATADIRGGFVDLLSAIQALAASCEITSV